MPHIHEKIDYTAEVFVVYKNTVLLRKHDKYKMWMSVGGHIELDEDPTQAAVREVKEEVGLDVKLADDLLPSVERTIRYRDLIPPKFLNRHRINETHEHVAFIYFATTDSDRITEGDVEVSAEMHWFTEEDLNNPAWGIAEDITHYARQALKELGK